MAQPLLILGRGGLDMFEYIEYKLYFAFSCRRKKTVPILTQLHAYFLCGNMC
jgi:hypothetical protein